MVMLKVSDGSGREQRCWSQTSLRVFQKLSLAEGDACEKVRENLVPIELMFGRRVLYGTAGVSTL